MSKTDTTRTAMTNKLCDDCLAVAGIGDAVEVTERFTSACGDHGTLAWEPGIRCCVRVEYGTRSGGVFHLCAAHPTGAGGACLCIACGKLRPVE